MSSRIAAGACLLSLAVAVGCASSRPCEPVVHVQQVEVPVPVYPHLQPLPELKLPAWPAPPAETATPEEWKDWYAAMAAVTRERLELLGARVRRLEAERKALEEHNGNESTKKEEAAAGERETIQPATEPAGTQGGQEP